MLFFLLISSLSWLFFFSGKFSSLLACHISKWIPVQWLKNANQVNLIIFMLSWINFQDMWHQRWRHQTQCLLLTHWFSNNGSWAALFSLTLELQAGICRDMFCVLACAQHANMVSWLEEDWYQSSRSHTMLFSPFRNRVYHCQHL